MLRGLIPREQQHGLDAEALAQRDLAQRLARHRGPRSNHHLGEAAHLALLQFLQQRAALLAQLEPLGGEAFHARAIAEEREVLAGRQPGVTPGRVLVLVPITDHQHVDVVVEPGAGRLNGLAHQGAALGHPGAVDRGGQAPGLGEYALGITALLRLRASWQDHAAEQQEVEHAHDEQGQADGADGEEPVGRLVALP